MKRSTQGPNDDDLSARLPEVKPRHLEINQPLDQPINLLRKVFFETKSVGWLRIELEFRGIFFFEF